MNTKQAAAYIGMSPKTLARMRVDGDGPSYSKIGRRVIYDGRQLDSWVAERRRRFIGGPGAAPVCSLSPGDVWNLTNRCTGTVSPVFGLRPGRVLLPWTVKLTKT